MSGDVEHAPSSDVEEGLKRILVRRAASGEDGARSHLALVVGASAMLTALGVAIFSSTEPAVVLAALGVPLLLAGYVGASRANARAARAMLVWTRGVPRRATVVSLARTGRKIALTRVEHLLVLEIEGAAGPYRASVQRFLPIGEGPSWRGRAIMVRADPDHPDDVVIEPELSEGMIKLVAEHRSKSA